MVVDSRRFDALIAEIRSIYGDGVLPLHRPVFEGGERRMLVECIDSNFVSSVGARVGEFEERVAAFTGSRFAVATVNGTAALHVALLLAGVEPGDEVITQALTFVATGNAIRYCGAAPVFVDVDRDTLGLSPAALRRFLEADADRRGNATYSRASGRRFAACVPMHTFGHPCRIAEIAAVCAEYSIPLVEDAAESLGSRAGERHTGTFGLLGTLSFNGNKIITTGGGGMILTDDETLARRAKHLTTTAKVPHPWEFVHDAIGYNYRMPNLNAALGCAQMERLPEMLAVKRAVAGRYAAFCAAQGWQFVGEPPGTHSNYWLNAVLLDSLDERDAFLEHTNGQGVMTRPVWRLLHRLEMFSGSRHDGLVNARWLEERLANLPSSVPDGAMARVAGD